ncbi:TonB-dependent receptor [Erythrobacter sp. SCSIO 43205]|nr:TonB-dependent receptor [Erythrobacter sp. SCSIO 43205]
MFATFFWGVSANSQTIENVATASWEQNGRTGSLSSNTVQTAVLRPAVAIATWVAAPGAGETISFQPARCLNSQGESVSGNGDLTISTQAIESQSVRLGQTLIVQFEDASLNQQAFAIDEIAVALAGTSGDSEQIRVQETGADTGIFRGDIAINRYPGVPVPNDCRIEAAPGDQIRIALGDASAPLGLASVTVLADPFGIVFDSRTGEPVSGARITMVDGSTGAPADIFAEDGETRWPSSVISGQTITDAAGKSYPMQPGEYWFPLAPLGDYRLVVEPPTPYSAPSTATPAELASLRRGDGQAFEISDSSFGGILSLVNQTPVEIDIPVDAAPIAIQISKSSVKQSALAGDNVFYAIDLRNTDPSRTVRGLKLEDSAHSALRYRRGSLRIDREEPDPDAVTYASDGSGFQLALGDLAPDESRRIVYAMSVRPDARAGQAVNTVDASDASGLLGTASATLRIERDNLAGRMTIIGRITQGPCSADGEREGVAGVRVMLEDGSYAITDADGRYHFEGVVPGSHIVRPISSTLPQGTHFADCERSVRTLGKADRKVIEGQGGSLVRADFFVESASGAHTAEATDRFPRIGYGNVLEVAEPLPEKPLDQIEVSAPPITEPADWLALGDGPDGWLAPALDENPRAPVVKVAIRHRKGQTVRLFAEGEEVSPVAFDGTLEASDGNYAVSLWRGIPLLDERTKLSAQVYNSFGGLNQTIEREVFFTSQPAKVELDEAQSSLIADGQTKPVVAVRITDRQGRPVREGVSGRLIINQPYQSAALVDTQQLQQLTRSSNLDARWVIEGSDGVARIELAPTMISGRLELEFSFDNEGVERREFVTAWIAPGDVEWTIIGLAEGSVGARTVADRMETGEGFDSDLGKNARVALYAKGRVLGRYLVTLAYDSAKQEDQQPLLGALDPNAYYTVFGDGSSRRFDAASREKLYLRVESSRFNAVYGDFQTGFTQTKLGRYQRTATGLTAQARLGDASIEGFAAKIGSTFQRDEFQGNGLSGPYTLSARDIIANSETVMIEVRDRFRSEIIVSSQRLNRFSDYDIDLLSGTISFARPILSRDLDLNPQFIVVEYETLGNGEGDWNAGARIEYEGIGQIVDVGATLITDAQEGARTNIVAFDAEVTLSDTTRLRGEVAMSEGQGTTSTGWLAEVQHQSGDLDLLAYAQSVEDDFGASRISGAQVGRTKVGLDANLRLSDELSVIANAFQDSSLTSDLRRRAMRGALNYRTPERDLQLGLARFEDRLSDGSVDLSTLIEASANQRLLDSRLQVGLSTSFALQGPQSRDLPNRHSLDLRYALTPDVRLVGNYEIADGKDFSADTFRAGFELSPWQGAQITSAIGNQAIGEDASRTFAAYGLSQSLQVTPSLTIDASLEGNVAMSAAPPIDYAVNFGQPLANGSPVGQGGGLIEDFTAVTLSGTWRRERWNIYARGEYRDAVSADRWGASFGAVRQLGEGSIAGARFNWTNAADPNGASTQIVDASLSFAYRPGASPLSMLGKLEYRRDEVVGALLSNVSPLGRTALVTDGDAYSERLIASLSTNWSPGRGLFGTGLAGGNEFGLFVGARYGTDSFEGQTLDSLTTLVGLDARLSLSDLIAIGANANLRMNHSAGLTSYSYGPFVSVAAAEGLRLSLGHNFEGFTDADFELARQVRKGLWASFQFAFDEDLLGLE